MYVLKLYVYCRNHLPVALSIFWVQFTTLSGFFSFLFKIIPLFITSYVVWLQIVLPQMKIAQSLVTIPFLQSKKYVVHITIGTF